MFHQIRKLVARLRAAYELRKYSPVTIAEYLRRQGSQIGEGCFIVPTSLGTEPYLVKIGNHVAIAYGVTFSTHDGAAWIFRDQVPDTQVFGPIVIEDNCIIGSNAILLPNIRIGRNSVVGAGSVVISDVPPNSVVVGVPARPLGSVDKYREKCLERWKAQRPPDAILEPGETWWNSKHFSENREKLKRHLMQLFREQLQ
ncbi:DapH/DapD/GlmU-related protein [Sulfuricaulis sp.]|uniref:acyltransferase n=1 Tax=Sulfuricaulis sp. TaxID=2003553 RepID=UPI003559F62D